MITLEETTDVFHQLENGSLIVLPDSKHPIEKVPVTRLAFELNAFF